MNTDSKKPNWTCGDCVHVGPGPSTKQDLMARNCYRFPPTAIGTLTQQGFVIVAARPEIRVETPACGEFESPEWDDALGMPTVPL